MQYTLRKIPRSVDRALRDRAKREGKSLNEVAIEALARGAGISNGDIKRRDLADIAGTWRRDGVVDRALAEQRAIDEDVWK